MIQSIHLDRCWVERPGSSLGGGAWAGGGQNAPPSPSHSSSRFLLQTLFAQGIEAGQGPGHRTHLDIGDGIRDPKVDRNEGAVHNDSTVTSAVSTWTWIIYSVLLAFMCATVREDSSSSQKLLVSLTLGAGGRIEPAVRTGS